MSDPRPAIEAVGLSKVYRLYARPVYRFLDIFGLLRRRQGRYTEHPALDALDLTVRRGEKVAIIGRNGAGKSTLLKLISGVIAPTSGRIDVGGRVHALLSIGSGFHPEFTGRENIKSYLGHMGVSGRKAADAVEEIVDFAEIDEYIDQPMKTYSTGMTTRLMFAASTAITPDILILDEVLSVGDAYFAQKSAQRIREMCDDQGTTLLFVTHDLYSAIELCDRCVWLEKGVVVMDGEPSAVVNRYEASIRDQQEKRLRAKMLDTLEENREKAEAVSSFGQIRCTGNVPVDHPLPVECLEFYDGQTLLGLLQPGDAPNAFAQPSLEPEQGNWSPACDMDGHAVRCFTPEGSIYHRAGFVVRSGALAEALEAGRLRVRATYRDDAAAPCLLEIFHPNGNKRSLAPLATSGSGQWKTEDLAFAPSSTLETDTPSMYRYGNQRMSITDVSFLNAQGRPAQIFETGSAMTVRLAYRIRDPEFRQRPIINVNFLRDGVTRSHRFVLDSELFDAAQSPEGVLEIKAEPLLLCRGTYLVNVAVMGEGGYKDKQFFTANEHLLDHHSRSYQIKVLETGNHLVDDCMFMHPATWSKDGREVRTCIYGAPDAGS